MFPRGKAQETALRNCTTSRTFLSAQPSWPPVRLAHCPGPPGRGNWKTAAFQKDTRQHSEAAGRPAQLEITPVRTGPSQFDVLALSWRPCRGGLPVTAATEVSGPGLLGAATPLAQRGGPRRVSEPAASENLTAFSGPIPDLPTPKPCGQRPAVRCHEPTGELGCTRQPESLL